MRWISAAVLALVVASGCGDGAAKKPSSSTPTGPVTPAAVRIANDENGGEPTLAPRSAGDTSATLTTDDK